MFGGSYALVLRERSGLDDEKGSRCYLSLTPSCNVHFMRYMDVEGRKRLKIQIYSKKSSSLVNTGRCSLASNAS